MASASEQQPEQSVSASSQSPRIMNRQSIPQNGPLSPGKAFQPASKMDRPSEIQTGDKDCLFGTVNPELEIGDTAIRAFGERNLLDPRCIQDLLALTPRLRERVLGDGDIDMKKTQNPSACVTIRMKYAKKAEEQGLPITAAVGQASPTSARLGRHEAFFVNLVGELVDIDEDEKDGKKKSPSHKKRKRSSLEKAAAAAGLPGITTGDDPNAVDVKIVDMTNPDGIFGTSGTSNPFDSEDPVDTNLISSSGEEEVDELTPEAKKRKRDQRAALGLSPRAKKVAEMYGGLEEPLMSRTLSDVCFPQNPVDANRVADFLIKYNLTQEQHGILAEELKKCPDGIVELVEKRMADKSIPEIANLNMENLSPGDFTYHILYPIQKSREYLKGCQNAVFLRDYAKDIPQDLKDRFMKAPRVLRSLIMDMWVRLHHMNLQTAHPHDKDKHKKSDGLTAAQMKKILDSNRQQIVDIFIYQLKLDNGAAETLKHAQSDVRDAIIRDEEQMVENASNPSASVIARIAKLRDQYNRHNTDPMPVRIRKFMEDHKIDPSAQNIFFQAPEEVQRLVIEDGPLIDARNVNAVLVKRINTKIAAFRQQKQGGGKKGWGGGKDNNFGFQGKGNNFGGGKAGWGLQGGNNFGGDKGGNFGKGQGGNNFGGGNANWNQQSPMWNPNGGKSPMWNQNTPMNANKSPMGIQMNKGGQWASPNMGGNMGGMGQLSPMMGSMGNNMNGNMGGNNMGHMNMGGMNNNMGGMNNNMGGMNNNMGGRSPMDNNMRASPMNNGIMGNGMGNGGMNNGMMNNMNGGGNMNGNWGNNMRNNQLGNNQMRNNTQMQQTMSDNSKNVNSVIDWLFGGGGGGSSSSNQQNNNPPQNRHQDVPLNQNGNMNRSQTGNIDNNGPSKSEQDLQNWMNQAFS